MTEILGLLFFVLLGVGIFFGLRVISRERVSTAEEFEKSASEGPSLVGAGVKALQDMLDPPRANGEKAVVEMKEGRHVKVAVSGEGFRSPEELAEIPVPVELNRSEDQ